jgi:hypothetical protein
MIHGDEDNIDAAMDAVASTMSFSRKKSGTGRMGEPTQKQVLIRATEKDHERWKRTADIKGVSVAEMIRDLCNRAASEALDCQHPVESRKQYPWAEICTKCDTRLRG